MTESDINYLRQCISDGMSVMISGDAVWTIGRHDITTCTKMVLSHDSVDRKDIKIKRDVTPDWPKGYTAPASVTDDLALLSQIASRPDWVQAIAAMVDRPVLSVFGLARLTGLTEDTIREALQGLADAGIMRQWSDEYDVVASDRARRILGMFKAY